MKHGCRTIQIPGKPLPHVAIQPGTIILPCFCLKRNCQTARHCHGKIGQNLRPAMGKDVGAHCGDASYIRPIFNHRQSKRIVMANLVFAQCSITNNPDASRDRIVYLPNIQSQTTKHPVGANLVFALMFNCQIPDSPRVPKKKGEHKVRPYGGGVIRVWLGTLFRGLNPLPPWVRTIAP
jgi:hypothetical protein